MEEDEIKEIISFLSSITSALDEISEYNNDFVGKFVVASQTLYDINLNLERIADKLEGKEKKERPKMITKEWLDQQKKEEAES